MIEETVRHLLLAKGYFPKELPPVFTTSDFGMLSGEIVSDWSNSSVFKLNTKGLGKTPSNKRRSGSYTYHLTCAEPELMSKPKRGYERRDLHITHPVPQALLVDEIANGWRNIQKWVLRQKYSLDELRISPEFERSIKSINFAIHREKNEYIEATSNWLVKTDITRFYPSIYTHSIPWAAYGKERVKAALGSYKGSLADRLDLLVRACNRNQTIGIPIGPETSRILAEIISAQIDCHFQDCDLKIPPGSVDRLQDDWMVGVETLEKAEAVLSRIRAIYRNYGLDINGSKTSIEHIVAMKEESWISEIGSFLSHKRGSMHGPRLREFLKMCLRLQAAFQSQPVINYALAVVESHQILRTDVSHMESFLLKAAVVAPNSLDRICRIMLDMQYNTKSVSAPRVASRFLALAESHIEKEHHYEVIWLLYTMRGLGRRFASKKICEAIEELPSSAIALLLLDMKVRGTVVGRLPKASWERRITKESIASDWTWLLGYEGFRHGWLSDGKRLMKTSLFKPMASRNVVFYDERRNMQKSRSFVANRQVIRRNEQTEVAKFLVALTGIDTREY